MKPGRNDPCPCGSGKKYKHCCLAKEQAQTSAPQELVWRRLRRLKDEGGYATMLLRFVRDAYGEAAIAEAWDEFTLWGNEPFDRDSPHLPVFMPWLFSQWVPDPEENTKVANADLHGVPPARALLERKERTLEPLLREYLESCLDSPLSFYEALAVKPGRGISLRNVLTGEEHEVLERSASQFFQPGDLLFGQIASAQGVSLLEASGPVVIPPMHKIEVIELRQRMDKGSQSSPREKLREYDMELRELYLDITENLLHPKMPELRNTDGERLVPQTLVFDIESAQEAFDALKSLDFEADDDGDHELERAPDGSLARAHIAWKKPGNAKNKGWANTVLGSIRIAGKRMTADVNSHERAEAFRKIVVEKLGAQARYRVTEIQSLEKALEDPAKAEPLQPQTEPAFAQLPQVRAAVAEHMARHYEHWVEEALPALGNRTPLQAMQDPDGPEMVEALVRDAERLGRRMDPPVDEAVFHRLRERLGLPPSD